MALTCKLSCARIRIKSLNNCVHRAYSSAIFEKGLVLGVHTDKEGSQFTLSPQAKQFDEKVQGKLTSLLKLGKPLKVGQSRLLWGLTEDYPVVAAVGTGPKDLENSNVEGIDQFAENVRIAAGAGCGALAAQQVSTLLVDDMGEPRAAAEGAALSTYLYQEFRTDKKLVPIVKPLCKSEAWNLGAVGAETQNWVRFLVARPANHLTPTIFAEEVRKTLEPLGCKVIARDRAWAEKERMNLFLSVAAGSRERQEPVFLEIHYQPKQATDTKPIVLVGKGVTFDTGGVSLKPSKDMDFMRGDCGGAATVCGAIRAAAILKLPLNIVGLVPLTENGVDGGATKPGDVFVGRSGKSVEVNNTDAEGRLILADALSYAHDFSPRCTLDMATLTGAVGVALGSSASGLFTADPALQQRLLGAAHVTGDRFWPLPLYKAYEKRITDFKHVDLHNLGKGSGAGSSMAAAFLLQFAPPGPWAHLDIACTMSSDEEQPYISKGCAMSGRPLRTIVEFLRTYDQK